MAKLLVNKQDEVAGARIIGILSPPPPPHRQKSHHARCACVPSQNSPDDDLQIGAVNCEKNPEVCSTCVPLVCGIFGSLHEGNLGIAFCVCVYLRLRYLAVEAYPEVVLINRKYGMAQVYPHASKDTVCTCLRKCERVHTVHIHLFHSLNKTMTLQASVVKWAQTVQREWRYLMDRSAPG